MSRIHVIGLGVGDRAQLSPEAEAALVESAIVVGSERQLLTVSSWLTTQKKQQLPKLRHFKQWLIDHEAETISVLASGDPLFFGIGKWLGKHFSERIRSYPAISSIQFACHALNIALQDTLIISLHGRPMAHFRQRVRNHQQYILLTDTTNTPAAIAEEAINAGFNASEISVLERLGYPDQSISHFLISDHPNGIGQFDDLNLCYLKTAGQGHVLPEFPGIPDNQFVTEKGQGQGMITKREVRLSLLSLLQPKAQEIGWDVGAGCGSVAIEWGLWSRHTDVYAIEQHEGRYQCLLENKNRFGVVNLQAIHASAPLALKPLPDPDAIFIGGSEGELLSLMTYCWARLKLNGRLVVSAVTEDARMALYRFLSSIERPVYEISELAVKKETLLGRHRILKPALPVTLLKITKSTLDNENH